MDHRLTKEELKTLRDNLPQGSHDLIAAEVGMEVSSVQQILYKPERFNSSVINAAVTIAEKHKLAKKKKQEVDDIRNRVQALAQ